MRLYNKWLPERIPQNQLQPVSGHNEGVGNENTRGHPIMMAET